MIIDTEKIVTLTEANQNFSKVAKEVEQMGKAVIFKNNKPKFLIVDIEQNPVFDLTHEEEEKIWINRHLEEHKKAYEELAK